jgi:hypothetical protein
MNTSTDFIYLSGCFHQSSLSQAKTRRRPTAEANGMVECFDSHYLKDKLIGAGRRVAIDWKPTLELHS